jgi:hypothetical protein
MVNSDWSALANRFLEVFEENFPDEFASTRKPLN